LNSLGSYFMNYVTRSADKLLIGLMSGPMHLGIYDRAYHIFVQPVNQVSYPLTGVAVVTLSKLKEDPPAFIAAYAKAAALTGLVGMWVSAVAVLNAADIVLVLLGENWKSAGPVLAAFAPAIGMMLIYGTHGWLHLALGKAGKWMIWSIFSTVVILAAFLVGVQYGAIGVAAGYAASLYLLTVPGLWFAGKPVRLPLRTIVSFIGPYLCAGAVAVAVCHEVRWGNEAVSAASSNLNPWSRLFLSATLCSCLYFACVCALFRSFDPVRQIWRIIHRLKPGAR
jgi:PST family polysaccharide transporter